MCKGYVFTGVCLQGVSLSGGSLSRWSLPGGLCLAELPAHGKFLYRSARILLTSDMVQSFEFNSAFFGPCTSFAKHSNIYTYRAIRRLLIDSGSGCTTVFCANSWTGRKTLSSGGSLENKRRIPLPERNSERQRKIGNSDSAVHSLVGCRSS